MSSQNDSNPKTSADPTNNFARTTSRSSELKLSNLLQRYGGLLLISLIILSCKLFEPPRPTDTPRPTVIRQTATPRGHPTISPTPSATPSAHGGAPTFAIPSEQLSAGDPYVPELGNRGYDVAWYDLRLTLDPLKTDFAAVVLITATATTRLEAVSLDFVGFQVTAAAIDGEAVSTDRLERKLIIQLPHPLEAGIPFGIRIAYRGSPTREPSAFIPFVPAIGLLSASEPNILYVASEPDGSRYWFPCNDHPRDKAAYRFELHVPPGYIGVANGKLTESAPEAGIYIWVSEQPIATAFVTVAVGDYVLVEGKSPQGIPLRSYVFPEMEDDFREYEDVIGEMLDWMSERFGTYPFDKFGYVSVNGLDASLETQTLVLLDRPMLNEMTLVHEMAHMWFGDWVSVDSWGEIWRSEGFATYVSYLWLDRDDKRQLADDLAEIAQTIEEHPSDYPLNDPPPGEMFGRDSYLKGALLAHALHQRMGDGAFYSGLELYFSRYGGGVASDAQFQAALEEAAGYSLADIFGEWLK